MKYFFHISENKQDYRISTDSKPSANRSYFNWNQKTYDESTSWLVYTLLFPINQPYLYSYMCAWLQLKLVTREEMYVLLTYLLFQKVVHICDIAGKNLYIIYPQKAKKKNTLINIHKEGLRFEKKFWSGLVRINVGNKRGVYLLRIYLMACIPCSTWWWGEKYCVVMSVSFMKSKVWNRSV